MTNERTLAQLVSVACHDLRTPLATVYGFARTLERLGLEPPADRYVGMISAASDQLGELLDMLTTVARIEAGRFDPHLVEVDSLELAREAAAQLDSGRVGVSGEGTPVRVEHASTRRAIAQLARATARHGGHETVSLDVQGPLLSLSPLARPAEAVVLGEALHEFSAPAAGLLIRALGGSLEARDGALVVSLPAA